MVVTRGCAAAIALVAAALVSSPGFVSADLDKRCESALEPGLCNAGYLLGCETDCAELGGEHPEPSCELLNENYNAKTGEDAPWLRRCNSYVGLYSYFEGAESYLQDYVAFYDPTSTVAPTTTPVPSYYYDYQYYYYYYSYKYEYQYFRQYFPGYIPVLPYYFPCAFPGMPGCWFYLYGPN
eukprot:INCI248.1.p2 GENE.INCI248.1~~INCI248.1.p2  ORF type:complete len:181 (-),score=18.48 INCI248.1:327-869(-)